MSLPDWLTWSSAAWAIMAGLKWANVMLGVFVLGGGIGAGIQYWAARDAHKQARREWRRHRGDLRTVVRALSAHIDPRFKVELKILNKWPAKGENWLRLTIEGPPEASVRRFAFDFHSAWQAMKGAEDVVQEFARDLDKKGGAR